MKYWIIVGICLLSTQHIDAGQSIVGKNVYNDIQAHADSTAGNQSLIIPETMYKSDVEKVIPFDKTQSVDYHIKVIQPDPGIDYKILIKEPDQSIDYKMIIKNPLKTNPAQNK